MSTCTLFNCSGRTLWTRNCFIEHLTILTFLCFSQNFLLKFLYLFFYTDVLSVGVHLLHVVNVLVTYIWQSKFQFSLYDSCGNCIEQDYKELLLASSLLLVTNIYIHHSIIIPAFQYEGKGINIFTRKHWVKSKVSSLHILADIGAL